MSYEIIYKTGSVKQENNYFPITIMGSNNCTEFINGRERRERNAESFNIFAKDKKINCLTRQELNNIENYTRDFKKGIEEGSIKTHINLFNGWKNKIIPSENLFLYCKVRSFYYADLNEKDKDIIQNLADENEFNKFLTIEEQFKASQEFLLTLKKNNVSKKVIEDFKNYFSDDNFYINCVNADSFINNLPKNKRNFSIKKYSEKDLISIADKGLNPHDLKPKPINKENVSEALKNYDLMHEKLINLYDKKQVVLYEQKPLSDYKRVYKGRARAYNNKLIIMFPRSKKRYYNVNWNSVKKINTI